MAGDLVAIVNGSRTASHDDTTSDSQFDHLDSAFHNIAGQRTPSAEHHTIKN